VAVAPLPGDGRLGHRNHAEPSAATHSASRNTPSAFNGEEDEQYNNEGKTGKIESS